MDKDMQVSRMPVTIHPRVCALGVVLGIANLPNTLSTVVHPHGGVLDAAGRNARSHPPIYHVSRTIFRRQKNVARRPT